MSDNELIARFDGWIFDEDKFQNNGRVKWWHPEKTKPILGDTVLPVSVDRFRRYQESWDWLMPVVEKIDKLWTSPDEDGEYPEITKQVMVVTTLPVCTSIQTIYRNVVEFIKWYNESKKENV